MRNYKQIDQYLDMLEEDVYPQPQDEGHTLLANRSIGWLSTHLPPALTVLDVGAGEGFCQDIFLAYGYSYAGISLGEDCVVAKANGKNVHPMDFNFLTLEDETIDLVYSRHSLEHSFSPLISLLEWRRVSRKYLAVILPAPEHYKPGGRNHPFVLYREQWLALFEIAGWKIEQAYMELGLDKEIWEYWYICSKTDRPDYSPPPPEVEDEEN